MMNKNDAMKVRKIVNVLEKETDAKFFWSMRLPHQLVKREEFETLYAVYPNQ